MVGREGGEGFGGVDLASSGGVSGGIREVTGLTMAGRGK